MAIFYRGRRFARLTMGVVAAVAVTIGGGPAPGQAAPAAPASAASSDVRAPRAHIDRAVAHDESAPLRTLARHYRVPSGPQVACTS